LNHEFFTVLIFLAIGIGFVFVALLAGYFIRPKIENAEKKTTYECGERPFAPAWFNFNPRFYVIANIFIVFDVALAISFPPFSAMNEYAGKGGQWAAAGALLFFLAILGLGLAYVWGKGDLEWPKN